MIEGAAAKSFLPLLSAMWYAENVVVTDDR